MRVPLLDLEAQMAPIADEVKKAVLDTVNSGRYIMGPQVEALEREVAAFAGADHGVAMSSGTDALLAALMALGTGANDTVVTTPYSFFATAGVVARLGARPAFVDIDPATFNLGPQALESWFETCPAPEQVKAIVPVHLFGQCAGMDPIRAVAARYGVPVVEDAAQAIGAGYPSGNGLERAGSMGRMGCFSFFPSKNLGAMGDGGMVVTNDDSLAARLRMLRNHGDEGGYSHIMVGGNFRLDAMQAAVLRVKLPHLPGWTEARRENAAYYDAAFADSPIETPQAVYGREHHVYNQYVIRVPERRDELKAHLAAQEIGCSVYYPRCFHEQPCFAGLGYQKGAFPQAEDAAARSLALPIYGELTSEMLETVVRAVLEFYH